MEYIDIMVNGKCNGLQKTLEEEAKYGNKVFEDKTLILNEEIKIENAMYG